MRGRAYRRWGCIALERVPAREAEGEGFEPSVRLTTHNGFRDRRIQPLCHPSGRPRHSTRIRFAGPWPTPGRRAPPDLTDEQREIQALAREFARAEIRPIAAEVDESDVVSPLEVVHRAAEVGLTSFMLPEEVGGGGIGDVLTGCIVQEELNWGCAGDRQPDHLGRVLRPAAARGRHAGAARALAAAAVRPARRR